MNDIKSYTVLSNGVKMPCLGYGTYKVEDGESVIESVKEALKLGYRHIDTASYYFNEDGVGRGIKESGIKREEIFLVSKVWNTDQGYENTIKSFNESIKRLGVDYLDLYLIHWPQKISKDTWRALEKLYKDGLVRAIGVSNFLVEHLQDLMRDAEIMPMINQIEFHPQLIQYDLMEFCKKNDIRIEAWSPLMRGKVFEIELFKELSKKYGKTISQIVLRWDLQMGVVSIPKSVNPLRIKENSEIFDFQISKEDIEKINELNIGLRLGANPDDVYNNPNFFNK